MKKVAVRLDHIANTLEQKGFSCLASSLDVVANTLEEEEVTGLVQKGLNAIKSKRSLLDDPAKVKKLLDRMMRNPKMVDIAHKWIAKHPLDAEKLSEKIEGMSKGHNILETVETVKCASLFNSLRGVKKGVLLAVLLAMGSAYAGGTTQDLPNTATPSEVSYDGGTPTLDNLEKNLVSFTEGDSGHELFKTLHALTTDNPNHSMDTEILKVIHKHLPPNLAQRLIKTFDLKADYSQSYEESNTPEGVGAIVTKNFKAGETKTVNTFEDPGSADEFRYNVLGSNFERGLKAKGLTMSTVKTDKGYDLVVHPETSSPRGDSTVEHGKSETPSNLAKVQEGFSRLFGKA